MKLLDTNVILYALGRPHPYKMACARLVEAIVLGDDGYAVDVELLQEVLYVYASRGELARGLKAFDELMRILPSPFPIGRLEMVNTRWILERYPALSPRDAIHAAVVQTRGLDGIVTTDRAFREVHGLTVFDPLDLAAGA